MIRSTKQRLIRVSEALVAIGAVLIFYLIFIAVVGMIFPEGTDLGGLSLTKGRDDSQVASSRIDLDVIGAESFIAVLSETQRSVKNKRADAIAWSDARTGMALGERHSVQTLERAVAVISFGGDDQLMLDENSLVVIRSLTRHARQSRRRASVVALEGTFRGRVPAGAAATDDLEIEVVTANGTARIQTDDGRPTDFNVSVNPDATSTFSVQSGTFEVTSAGETVTIGPNQTVTVTRSQPPGRPVALPEVPSLVQPDDGTALTFRSLPPPVRFEWSGETDEYRLEIGRDSEFSEIVYEQQLSGFEFEHGNLPAGRLYWRVTALEGWAEGPAGAPHSLDLIRDTEAPGLQVSFPEGNVPVSGAQLHGIAEPGARVFVSDHDVPLEDTGSFEYALKLEPGLNLVVVEAIDPAGNVTYRSKLITAEQGRPSR